jgi:DNA-binding response OmpR family regulator
MPGVRILLAEDEAAAARPLIAALQDRGHEVRWVRAVREVRSQLTAFDPQVLLLDVTLDTDGLELLQAIRFDPLCPPGGVLVLTDPDDIAARERAHQLGATAVVAKSRDSAEAVQAVEELLAFL